MYTCIYMCLSICLKRSGQITRPMPIGKPLRRANTFCLVKKKKKTLDLHVLSRIGNTMKKLQLISNTTMNTSVMKYFDNAYISTHGLGNI